MNFVLRSRLSVMMFIEYIIWGLWYSTLGAYMSTKGFSATQIPLAYSSTAIASMISPFFVGMVADRFFATERVMSVLSFLGAGFAILAVIQNDFNLFFTFLLLHTICYMPTLPLANSLSFKHLDNPGEQFPYIRVFGSLGWIAAGFIISALHYDKSAGMFYVTAVFSAAMGIYCLTLPHTPPVQSEKAPTVRDILGLDALALMKDRNVLVFMLGSFLTCIPITFYFNETGLYLAESGIEKIAMTMTIGQWIEVGFFLIMPIMFKELGIKKVLLLGMLCWVLRLSCFGGATGTTGDLWWMIIMGIALHGMAYDFFFVSGQIYIDKRAPEAIRSNAQGFLYFMTLGAGFYVGSLVVAAVNAHYSTVVDKIAADGTIQQVTQYDWTGIWYFAAILSVIIFLLFALAFKDQTDEKEVAARRPMRAWGVIAGIVVIMFALSFGLQYASQKDATCAGYWTGDKSGAKIAADITTAKVNAVTTGSIILTQTEINGTVTYQTGAIEDMKGTVYPDVNPDRHLVTFPVTVYSNEKTTTKDAEGKEVTSATVLKKGTGYLNWVKNNKTLSYQFVPEGEELKPGNEVMLEHTVRVYQKK